MSAGREFKNTGTIRGKIVWGYVGIYGIIALIAAAFVLISYYFIIEERIRKSVISELNEVLAELPRDASEDDLYEILNSNMPGYVERYDLYLSQEVVAPYSETENSDDEPRPSIAPEDSAGSEIITDTRESLNQYGQPTFTPEDVAQDDGSGVQSGSNQYLQPTQTPLVLPDIIATYYPVGTLNVRSGPSVDFDIVGVLHENERVDITDMSGQWYQIIYDGQVSWVYGPYLMDHPSTYVEKTHLLSSAGVDFSYQSTFDYDQAYSSISNIIELSRFYLAVTNMDYNYNGEYNYDFIYNYSLEAVIDVDEAIIQTGIEENIWDLVGITAAFVVAFFLGLVIIIIYGAYKTRKFLKPIEDITNLVSQINESNLSRRIDVESARYELKELVMTINGMLDRVYAGYAKQKMFVSDVSHELRTPISVVAGYANMLNRWAKDDQAVFDESVQAIIEEADNMKYLVDNLLFLVRSDNNTIHYDMEKFDLSGLMQDVYKSSLLIDNNKHNITSEIEEDIFISGDRTRIKQAARIFMENAMKYTPPMGNIIIGLKKENNGVVISIADDGIGISKKDMAHIFKRFYRGDKSRNRQAGGYGLGLPIARNIINAHDGKIHLRSKENDGTIIDVILNS